MQITRHELQRILTHRYLYFFLVVCCLLITFLDAHGYRQNLDLGRALFLWSFCVVLVISLYFAMAFLLMYVQNRLFKIPVYLPAVGVFCMTFATFVLYYSGTFLTHEPVNWMIAVAHMPTNFVIVLVFESVFIHFVLPTIRPTPASTNEPLIVSIAGAKISASKIQMIQSQGHYLEVTTDDKKSLLRARLSDVTAQLPPTLGLVPHRSFWVAKSALDPKKISIRKQTLGLLNGEEVPIARSRKSTTQSWIDNNMLV